MLRILVIDDHPLVGDGISVMIKDTGYLEIMGCARTAAEALALLADTQPDVILLDISLPDMNGLELCTLIREKYKQVKIIGLSSANESGLITQLLKRGANGYLLKNMERNELLLAIDRVMNGKLFLSTEANEKLLEQFHSVNDALQQAPVLTRREKEILQALQEGLNGPQIAEKLFLSPYTVETHRKNLLQKFNVSNTQALLRNAREHRLIN